MKTLTVSLSTFSSAGPQTLSLTGTYRDGEFFNGITVRYAGAAVCSHKKIGEIQALVVRSIRAMRAYEADSNSFKMKQQLELINKTFDEIISGDGCWLEVSPEARKEELERQVKQRDDERAERLQRAHSYRRPVYVVPSADYYDKPSGSPPSYDEVTRLSYSGLSH